MTIDKAIEVLESWRNLSYQNDDGTDDDPHELLLALDVVIPIVRKELKQKIKAYRAWDNGSDERYTTILFALNATDAKKIALSTEVCEYAKFTDIRVNRAPYADGLYKGRPEVDWYDDETRLTLVRDFGWSCFETSSECGSCVARGCCRHWEGENASKY